ncbi:APG9-domain-containing protein [Zopfochytrium polystomum]|nr:APG9-domain-containing protein [Zopfochytrium polystomum]
MLGAVGSSNPNSAGINGTRSQPQRRVLFGRSPASIARTRRDGEDSGDTAGANVSGRGNSRSATAWRVWNETRNLDEFLSRVYEYFLDKGYTCCLLSRICNLCILAFIIWFSTFLAYCVDYRLIAKERTLVEVLRPQCVKNIHGLSALLLVTFSIWWVWQAFRLILDIPRLWEMKVFYEELLEIAEGAMDSLEWQEVVDKLVKLKSSTDGEAQSRRTERLDAFAIANRIMRKENYLIALFNKDILDLRLPYMGSKQMLTKIIEWNLSFCIIAYLFDDNGSVRKRFLKESNRRLQKRFTMMALLNLLFAPFLLVLMILYFLFRSAEEYQKDPSSLGARQYTPYARWKFREFNELPHVFQRRLSRSYPNASKYLEQFPKRRIIILARFVSFIAGAFAAALAAITIIDQDILMGFEISPGRSALFYITVFGGILAASRSLTPDENQIFEPERIIREVAEDTHYLPETWRGKLHTEEASFPTIIHQVKAEFSALFDFKLLVFVQEIFSVLYAPIILYYSLPKCSEDIIDFCRDFTVQMDSIGYVCSFAVFNLRAHGNPKYGAPTEASNDHLMTKEGKMEQSFVYFKANNPKWEPGTDGSQFLQTLSRASRLPIFNAEASPSMENSVFRPRVCREWCRQKDFC